MVKLVNEGATMIEALREAMANAIIKERYFFTHAEWGLTSG